MTAGSPGRGASGPSSRDDVAAEVVGLLGRLIRADTSNPPGDVRPAVAVLEEYFASRGVPCSVVGEAPELGNVLARLPGSGGGPSLLLFGHTDVVPAVDDGWTEPPFSGRVRDGYVWGRGALDMKNQVAAQAVAFVRLAHAAEDGARLRGDLVFAATANEEAGDQCGAKWLFAQRPDLVHTDLAINEGGWGLRRPGAGPLFLVYSGEKGHATVTIRVSGHGGHGSMPRHTDNAITGLGEVLTAIAAHEPEVMEERIPAGLIETTVADSALCARLKDPATAQRAVRELALTDPGLAAVIEPLFGVTLSATVARTRGDAVNVIPDTAEVKVDCRILPGQSAADVYREVERALSCVGARWHITSCDLVEGSSSAAEGPLLDAVTETLAAFVPGSHVFPVLCPGFTDATHVRETFPDSVAYGICPFVEEDFRDLSPRFHAVDERIAVADLVLQAEFYERLAARVLA